MCILNRSLLDVTLLVIYFCKLKKFLVGALYFSVNIRVQQRENTVQYYVGRVSLVEYLTAFPQSLQMPEKVCVNAVKYSTRDTRPT